MSKATGPLGTVQMVTVREAATALRVSPMTIYRMVTDGELSSLRVRGSIRIPLDAITSIPGWPGEDVNQTAASRVPEREVSRGTAS